LSSRGPGRKCKNIGRAVNPPPIAIELPLFGIIGENDDQLDLMREYERRFRLAPRQRQPRGAPCPVVAIREYAFPRLAPRNDVDLGVRATHDKAERVPRSRAS
jgi:hypothetical protein